MSPPKESGPADRTRQPADRTREQSAPAPGSPAPEPPSSSERHGVISDLRTLAVHHDFRKLFSVRLVSQCGDGMFQAGLATLFFFNPQNLATAGQVAAAFAVLLVPFTVVGPFAGPLLDRWRRRQVLLYGNTLRVLLTLILATLMMTVGVGPAVYVLALVTLGINRFLLAALSAGLPRVVPRHQLLMANTLTPTLGAVSAVVGAGIGFGLGLLIPEGGPAKNGAALICAATLFGGAAALALRLRPGQLGPEESRTRLPALTAIKATASELAGGARYLIARRTPGLGLGVMAVHRFLYGINFIALILISRNLLTEPTDAAGGLATFGVLTGISFLGNGAAIVLTPIAHERMRPSAWVALCLLIGAGSQMLLITAPVHVVIAISAFLLGLSVQGAKIAVDTIVQRDTDDAYRGRAFALYDVLYNGAFAGAAAVAAGILPDDGWARPVWTVLALCYVIVAFGYRRSVVRIHDQPQPVPA